MTGIDGTLVLGMPKRRPLRLLDFDPFNRFFRPAIQKMRAPSSLRARFLLFAALLVALSIVQGLIGWAVVNRSQEISRTADHQIESAMDDLNLLRTLKNMQVYTLSTQNLVSTAAVDDPITAKLTLKQMAQSYHNDLATLQTIVRERHMQTLGGIQDLDHRIVVAKDSFDQLMEQALKGVETLKTTGKMPPDVALQVGARVDGLYEHLDRMAEAVNLMAMQDQKKMASATADHQSVLRKSEWVMAIAAAIGLCVCAAVSWFVMRNIIRPMRQVAETTNQLAAGDLEILLPHFKAREIAEIIRALGVFRANLVETARLRAEQDEMAARAAHDKAQTLHNLADGLEASVKGVLDGIAASVGQLRGAAQSFSMVAENASRQGEVVAHATGQAAANVQTIAASTEQLSASIGEIGHQVSQASEIAGQAVSEAEQTSRIIANLDSAVSRIGTVAGFIAAIAHRTNLLALNASIEAARAGESGRGFAVVASEVKALATQTAQATGEIGEQISAVQSETRQAVQAIETISQTIGQISGISATVAAAVEEQGSATEEISRGVQVVACETQSVSGNIDGVLQGAQEIGEQANGVLHAAADLSDQSNALRVAVEQFIVRVRAG